MKRSLIFPLVLIAVVVLLSTLIVVREFRTERTRREKEIAEVTSGPPLPKIPPAQWTPRIRKLLDHQAWEALDHELDELEQSDPSLFRKDRLNYLRARVKLALDQWQSAGHAAHPVSHPHRSVPGPRALSRGDGHGTGAEARRRRPPP